MAQSQKEEEEASPSPRSPSINAHVVEPPAALSEDEERRARALRMKEEMARMQLEEESQVQCGR